jgi:eukaryotic-like serine/threonine-protein kinase
VTGRVIDMRFEVLERVGEGALFQVSKARDTSTGRVVAVKTLKPSVAEAAEVPMLLRRVAPELQNLNHSNIARVEEVGEENGLPYLVTEFVRGINLKERIRRIAPFTLSVAVDFAIAVGEALAQSHSEGVVHGDLRPQNVIVSPEGAVKVSDFGLWQVYSASQDALASNLTRAVHYQAPEVVSGGAPTYVSDLYSLGAILFEMLTGTLPYPADNPLMAAMKQQSDPVPSPRTLNPGVPRSIEGIVMKSLMKRPEERYKSASDLLSDLKSVRDALRFGKPLSWSPLENGPVAATPAGSGKPTREPAQAQATLGAAKMSSTTASDDRISPFLKLALAAVTIVLIGVSIVAVAVWMATFSKPPETSFPRLVGMKIQDARDAAAKANIRLMEHDEYNDKFEGGTVWKVEPDLTGRNVRPGRSINIWVSKGSRWVEIPDVLNAFKDEAEKKLKDAGLTLGNVDRKFDKKVAFDHVMAQNPRPRKRVPRDTEVHLVISEGPDPNQDLIGGDDVPGGSTPPPTVNPSGGPTIDRGPDPGTGSIENDLTPRTVNMTKKIPRDGKGRRNVRIDYEDAAGTHTAVDEEHDEGDLVKAHVTVIGRKMTVRVYYDDDPRPVSEQQSTIPESP